MYDLLYCRLVLSLFVCDAQIQLSQSTELHAVLLTEAEGALHCDEMVVYKGLEWQTIL